MSALRARSFEPQQSLVVIGRTTPKSLLEKRAQHLPRSSSTTEDRLSKRKQQSSEMKSRPLERSVYAGIRDESPSDPSKKKAFKLRATQTFFSKFDQSMSKTRSKVIHPLTFEASSKHSSELSVSSPTKDSQNSDKPLIFIKVKRTVKTTSFMPKTPERSRSPSGDHLSFFQFKLEDALISEKVLKFWEQCAKVLTELHTDRFISDPVISPVPEFDSSSKPVLAIDLDETLVHCCNFDGPNAKWEKTLTYYSASSDSIVVAKINVRPHAVWFLQQIREHYRVVIYTASDLDYASAVWKLLDPKSQAISKILARPSCIRTLKGFLVKDLRFLTGSETSRAVLVDNSPHCFAPQINNGIPILPYYAGQGDSELKKLLPFLVTLKAQPSFPDYLKNYFGLGKLIKCKSQEGVLRHLQMHGLICE